ncbi:MAG: ATP-binding protein [Methylotenera sp.]|uniref:ATP-binding protein n=1 Tax=Methylotenera sp. TaxID=2051956 RepID=UPI002487E445|nr:ATP-binding protein [Methylotenera sp.]MDI1308927.1 ATP-binding protein [Methylotenera sp.]
MQNNKLPELMLPEYLENPFIAKLPPLLSQRDLLDALAQKPSFDEKERSYPSHLRKHCLLRLGRYFEPLERQIQLADRFGMLLRQGYIGRNPLTHDYIRHLQNGTERIQAKSLHVPTKHPVENTANSFALVGCSGNGKSKGIERVLMQYKQCIEHTEPFSLIQIVWLKLDCPSQGSPKQLCINFFSAVDRLIGTNYLSIYGRNRISVDEMMVHMAHVANLHAIGVLVIDEIQHLNKTKMGPDALLNFLVTLVNTIAIPVIIIGTLSAIPMLQENFRQARRANGLGSLIWDAMPNNNAWRYFIDQLWSYQWTSEQTPLTEEIRTVLYDESQGIIDIVVKLIMLAQMRIISIREVKAGPEALTEALLRRVAKEDFKIVRPMLDALRAGDQHALQKYDDLLPLQVHVDKLMYDAIQQNGLVTYPFTETSAQKTEAQSVPESEANTQTVMLSTLQSLGVATDVANVLIQEAMLQHPSADPLLLMATISEKLTVIPKNKIARTKPSNTAKPEFDELPANDLRHITALGRDKGLSAYEALLQANMVKPPLLDFAA